MDLVPNFLRRRGNHGGEGWLIPHEGGRGLRPHDIEYARNMASLNLDYALGRGDFAPIPKRLKNNNDEDQDMDPDSTSNEGMQNQIDAPSMTLVGGETVGGTKGKLIGNTVSNKKYEHYYHEDQMGHSKKLRQDFYTWGMSIYGRKDPATNNTISLVKWGTVGTGGLAPAGLIGIKGVDIENTNKSMNCFRPWGNNVTNIDLAENIYSNAINFYLRDFIDNKLLNNSGTKGFFTSYNKFRLNKFTVEITPRTQHHSVRDVQPHLLNFARNNNGWQGDLAGSELSIFEKAANTSPSETEHIGYYFYRDLYGTYVDSSGNIAYTPNTALATYTASTNDSTPREQYVIKNLDRNLTYVNDGEKFSFTRIIKPQGSYYFSKDAITSNLGQNISTIVNKLEGQFGSDTIVSKLPEYFNLLFVPGTCKIEWSEYTKLNNVHGKGYIIYPNIATQLEIKTTATWEAFDYNYSDNSVQSLTDPLDKAILNYEVERSIQLGKLNRGVV